MKQNQHTGDRLIRSHMLSARRPLGYSVILATLAFSGCSELSATDPKPEPRREIRFPAVAYSRAAQTELDTAAQGRRTRGVEDEILRLEGKIPGFGGMYVDSDSTFVFYIPQGVSELDVEAVLAQTIVGSAIDQSLKTQVIEGRKLRFLIAQFPFSQLVVWQRDFTGALSSVKSLAGVDADESTNRIRVIIADEADRSAVVDIGKSLGIPEEAILVKIGPRMVGMANLRGTFRPTGGGIQLSNINGGICTLGFNTFQPIIARFYTAGHCAPGAAGSGGGIGTEIYQPVVGISYAIGTILFNPVWNETDPACTGYTRCTYADVLSGYYTNVTQSNVKIVYTAFPGLNNAGGSITTQGWWTNTVNATVFNVVGQTMDKMGRSTGWTRGTMSASCQNTPTQYGAVLAMVLCSDKVINSRVGEGDSGAPMFRPGATATSPLYIYGILFGGGPFNSYDDNINVFYCSANCEIVYSPLQNFM